LEQAIMPKAGMNTRGTERIHEEGGENAQTAGTVSETTDPTESPFQRRPSFET